MTETMEKSESIEIKASADRVWSVAADQFDKISEWASGVSASRPLSGPMTSSLSASAPSSGRVCKTLQGETVETFVAFDAEQQTFTYAITGAAMPGFVKNATNTWTIESLDKERARLTMKIQMATTGIIGALMMPMMKFGMGKLLRTNLEELKHFIETGEQHARKKAARG